MAGVYQILNSSRLVQEMSELGEVLTDDTRYPAKAVAGPGKHRLTLEFVRCSAGCYPRCSPPES